MRWCGEITRKTWEAGKIPEHGTKTIRNFLEIILNIFCILLNIFVKIDI